MEVAHAVVIYSDEAVELAQVDIDSDEAVGLARVDIDSHEAVVLSYLVEFDSVQIVAVLVKQH